MKISARELTYCTYMFFDKLLLGFEFITSSYQQIDQPLKNYHQRRGEDNWDVIFDTTWEGRSTCVSKNSLHCFTLIKIMVPRSETL